MPKQQVSFVLVCAETLPGLHVRVVGSSRSLGRWAPANGLPLQTSAAEFPTWRLQEPVDLEEDEAIEYKYVICDEEGHAEQWEDARPNRQLHLTSLWGGEASLRSGSSLMVTETFNMQTEPDELRFFTISDASPHRSGRSLAAVLPAKPLAGSCRDWSLVTAAAGGCASPLARAASDPGNDDFGIFGDGDIDFGRLGGNSLHSESNSRWSSCGAAETVDGSERHFTRSLFQEGPLFSRGTAWLGSWRRTALPSTVQLRAPLASICEFAVLGWEGPPETVRLLLSASVWFGTFMLWSFEYAVVVPYLNSVLGFDAVDAGLMWMAGPASSLIACPVVGVLSDRYRSRFGRRRPFIFGGVCATLISVTVFVSAPWVAQPGSKLSCYLAGISFCCINLSINTVQNSARALLSDIAGPRWQVRAQAVIALLCGAGYVVGFLVLWQWPDLLGHMVSIHVLGCAVLVITTALTIRFAVESPTLVRERRLTGVSWEIAVPDEQGISVTAATERRRASSGESSAASRLLASCPVARQVCAHFANLFAAVWEMPHVVKQIMVCNALSWFSWFCFLQILTQYFGVVVYGGDPWGNCEATPGSSCLQPTCNPCNYVDRWVGCRQLCMYQAGISAGALALLLQNVVTILVSLSLAVFQRHFGLRRCYRCTLFIQSSMLLLLASWSNDSNLALFCVAMTGISQAGTQVFPYALIGSVVADPGTKGLAMGVLTLSGAAPQFIDASYVAWLGTKIGLRCIIALGGCYAAIAFLAAGWLPADGHNHRWATKRVESERYRPLLEATHDGSHIITDADEAVSLLEDVVPRSGWLGSP